jgi:hypothetical protein
MQRATSYAELARRMGHLGAVSSPGLTTVAAITDDFAIRVIKERNDEGVIGQRRRDEGGDDLALLAARRRDRPASHRTQHRRPAPPPKPPSPPRTRRSRPCPPVPAAGNRPTSPAGLRTPRRAVRSYVRRGINEWDLLRLNPDAQLDRVVGDIHPTYDEDPTLEAGPEA